MTPMRSPGFSFSWSTRPMRGRKIVCRVEVLMTADLPTRVASRSMLAPSSAASSVTSRSRISTTFPTRYGSCLNNFLWLVSIELPDCPSQTLWHLLPVVIDLIQIVLDLLLHCLLLVRETIVLAAHNPRVVLY